MSTTSVHERERVFVENVNRKTREGTTEKEARQKKGGTMGKEFRKPEGRPVFPKKAVITSGMPYGNKELHFGHVGGLFVHADTFARFMRDRIGAENVIFVSGTDCYGSPILEGFRKQQESGAIPADMTIHDYVEKNHKIQKDTLHAYEI